MKPLVLFCVLLTGCTPVVDAQLHLLDVARKGLTDVGRSLDEKRAALAALEDADRARLDKAFDADVRSNAELTDAWVIEARTAYAAAIDAFARRRQQTDRAADADRANLAAIDAVLQQTQALGRAQQSLNFFQEKP